VRVLVDVASLDDAKRAALVLEALGFGTELEADDEATAEAWVIDALTRRCKLTSSEVELLVLLRKGASVKEAAEQLGVSTQTAEWHHESLRFKVSGERDPFAREWLELPAVPRPCVNRRSVQYLARESFEQLPPAQQRAIADAVTDDDAARRSRPRLQGSIHHKTRVALQAEGMVDGRDLTPWGLLVHAEANKAKAREAG
jgi:hypothetical protein